MSRRKPLRPVDDGHEHDFGPLADGRRLTDKRRCKLCGATILSGYELPLWPDDSSTAGTKEE